LAGAWVAAGAEVVESFLGAVDALVVGAAVLSVDGDVDVTVLDVAFEGAVDGVVGAAGLVAGLGELLEPSALVVMSRSTASKRPAPSGSDDANDDPAAGVVEDAGGTGVEVRAVKSLRKGTTKKS
jgi:hypothetical protein